MDCFSTVAVCVKLWIFYFYFFHSYAWLFHHLFLDQWTNALTTEPLSLNAVFLLFFCTPGPLVLITGLLYATAPCDWLWVELEPQHRGAPRVCTALWWSWFYYRSRWRDWRSQLSPRLWGDSAPAQFRAGELNLKSSVGEQWYMIHSRTVFLWMSFSNRFDSYSLSNEM